MKQGREERAEEGVERMRKPEDAAQSGQASPVLVAARCQDAGGPKNLMEGLLVCFRVARFGTIGSEHKQYATGGHTLDARPTARELGWVASAIRSERLGEDRGVRGSNDGIQVHGGGAQPIRR